MKPIQFSCTAFIPKQPAEICAEIANMDKWAEFSGYGMLPGIEEASYEKRTDNMIGSRIAVRNADGSNHIEEIYKWDPTKEVALKLMDFSPPLDRIAAYFLEEWQFEAQEKGTAIVRSFELYPKHWATRPFLWIISLFFRGAINHHLALMARS